MVHKADNDSPVLHIGDSSDEYLQTTNNVRPMHQVILFKHKDSSLQACLYFDDETGLWIIEYTRYAQVISSALYQSESTAHLMLRSLGYQQAHSTAC